jgi:hypothetical protein
MYNGERVVSSIIGVRKAGYPCANKIRPFCLNTQNDQVRMDRALKHKN